jgi:hypothetical protein
MGNWISTCRRMKLKSYLIHKNQPQVDETLKCKARNYETTIRKYEKKGT